MSAIDLRRVDADDLDAKGLPIRIASADLPLASAPSAGCVGIAERCPRR
jgi:hypothetical protein